MALGAELNITALTRGWAQHFRWRCALCGSDVPHAGHNKFVLAAAFSTRIAGLASGNANFLELTRSPRNKTLLRAVFEF